MPALRRAFVQSIGVLALALAGCTAREAGEGRVQEASKIEQTAAPGPNGDAPEGDGPRARAESGCSAVQGFPAPPPAMGSEVDPFVRELEARLQVTVPRWWVETLRSARPIEGDGAAHDLGIRDGGDRRGEVISRESGFRTRPTVDATTLDDGGVLLRNLRNELRVPSSELVPADHEAPATLDVVAGGDLFHVAAFDAGSGGFPFEVRAFVKGNGKRRWTSMVCGVNRTMLGGQGYLIVQLKRRENRLFVFSAESHGVALDILNAQTGETLARSIDGDWGVAQASASG